MGSERPQLRLVHAGAAHPDAGWIEEMHAALDWWSAQEVTSPTSSITGGGAIDVVEELFSQMHDAHPALLVPSATYGLRVALEALGVGAGDEVLCPELDWPSSYAAIRSLGAIAVPVPVDPTTLTIDPVAAALVVGGRTKAVVACHLHGTAADVPLLRALLPSLPVVEDAAQALGSTLDGKRVGTLGDLAVFSFGPGKIAGGEEGGVVLSADDDIHRAVISMSSHPVRQLLAGVADPEGRSLAVRAHPMTAIATLYRLQRCELVEQSPIPLPLGQGLVEVGRDSRRRSVSPVVAIRLENMDGSTWSEIEPPVPPGWVWEQSGASAIPGADESACRELLDRYRLAIPTPPVRT